MTKGKIIHNLITMINTTPLLPIYPIYTYQACINTMTIKFHNFQICNTFLYESHIPHFRNQVVIGKITSKLHFRKSITVKNVS